MTTSQFEEQVERESDLLTPNQRSLLSRVVDGGPLPLAEASSEKGELAALMASGRTSLRVVQYAWGLDFELVATGKDSRAVGGD